MNKFATSETSKVFGRVLCIPERQIPAYEIRLFQTQILGVGERRKAGFYFCNKPVVYGKCKKLPDGK
jgi:hypothetical protein